GNTDKGYSSPTPIPSFPTRRSSDLTTGAFTLTGPGNSAVAASVSCNNPCTTATLTPSSALANNTQYTATISTAAKAADGTALAKHHNSTRPNTWHVPTLNSTFSPKK